jgi:hypothetical protein
MLMMQLQLRISGFWMAGCDSVKIDPSCLFTAWYAQIRPAIRRSAAKMDNHISAQSSIFVLHQAIEDAAHLDGRIINQS